MPLFGGLAYQLCPRPFKSWWWQFASWRLFTPRQKKRPLISDHIKGPLVAAFRSPLMKALDRSVETLGLWIVTSSVTFIKSANQSSIKLCQMIDSYTDTLISCLCVICAIHYWHLTGHAEEMQQESQGKRSLARKQVAGIITHLFTFETCLSVINTLHSFYIE